MKRVITIRQILPWLAIAFILTESLGWATYAYFNSWFVTDDLKTFSLLMSSSFLDFIIIPIDIHFVPLHRLVNYLLQMLVPMNFAYSIGFLLLCHWVAIYYLYKLLEEMAAGPHNIFLLCVYTSNGYFASTLIWWTSGLHRFPYVLLSIACLYYFVRFLKERLLLFFWISFALFIIALGFYSKAVLIPIYLLCIHLCLRVMPGDDYSVFDAFAVRSLIVFFLISFFYAGLAVSMGDPNQATFASEITSVYISLLLGLSVSVQALLPSTIFFLRPTLVNVIGLAIIAFTSYKNPKCFVLWILALLCMVTNVLIIAVSARVDLFPAITAIVPRYHFEVVFLQILFISIILKSTEAVERNPSRKKRGAGIYLVACLFVFVYSVFSINMSIDLMALNAERYKRASVFGRNLNSELASYEEFEMLKLEDRVIPGFLTDGFISNPMNLSQFLLLYDRGVAEFVEEENADYRINNEGRFVSIE